MEYVGIHTQQKRNNFRSLMLLVLFPVLVLVLVLIFCWILTAVAGQESGYRYEYQAWPIVWGMFKEMAPFVFGGVLLWFVIAYFVNTSIINKATNSHTLDRKDNKRVYNLVENLCMAQGMPMPKVNVIEDDSLNAFASGINEKTYTVTLTRGIIEKLDDAELEGVIAHELSHIRNRDVRLLIVSIVFVGIFAMIGYMALRMAPRIRGRKSGGVVLLLLLIALLAGVGYLFSSLMKFAISRKREYLADAGAAEMTKNPQALAMALRKISDNPELEVSRNDVAQLFISHPAAAKGKKKSGLNSLFATHPPIENRIRVLEQF